MRSAIVGTPLATHDLRTTKGIKSMFSPRLIRSIAVGATAVAIGGGAYGILGATAGNDTNTATTTTSPSTTAGRAVRGGGGSNAWSGPAEGGTSGTVASVSKPGFTISTSAGQTVTINKASTTTYRKGTTSASASAVKKGRNVLVVGMVDPTTRTITASHVIVKTTGGGSATAKVVPFQPGAPSTAKQVGQIPASYTQGSGTIVSGTTANKATKVALAAYAGGIVDRVVKLSNGEYEVHNIGVNWPHHIFVNKHFKVIGAN
jgi:hypothetical protein